MDKYSVNWDLNDLYPSFDSEEYGNDLNYIISQSDFLKDSYEGKISQLSGEEFNKFLTIYEQLGELSQKIGTFAFLNYALKSVDSDVLKNYSNLQDLLKKSAQKLTFVNFEINSLSNDELENKISSFPANDYFKTFINNVRLYKEHQLEPTIENVISKVSTTSYWVRLFDQTMAEMRFDLGGEKLTESEILDKMNCNDSNVREKATYSFLNELKKHASTFTLITNVLAKSKNEVDELRNYNDVISSRNLSNNIDDDAVSNLIEVVKESYEKISHRYYGLKAKIMGKEKLDIWDRNVSLGDSEMRMDYDDAVDLVLESYKDFSSKLHEVAVKFFENKWVDVYPNEGKRSGAFAHPCVPSSHPYLLLNYQGKVRDVMTLAHELGHGCHQYLSNKEGLFNADTPLTLSETASVFGEMLVFNKILSNANDNDKKIIIASKIEDMINTVIRQISFCDFELQVHKKRKEGELSKDDINDIWYKIMKDSLGPSFNYIDESKVTWSYIPHFIHSPFYVYSYAFGDCFVNNLFKVYKSGFDDFELKYIEMLSCGGKKRYDEVLKEFNLNADDKEFWLKGISLIEEYIDELDSLVN